MLEPSFENSTARTSPIPSDAPVISIVLFKRSIFIVEKSIHTIDLDDALHEYDPHDHWL